MNEINSENKCRLHKKYDENKCVKTCNRNNCVMKELRLWDYLYGRKTKKDR